MKFYFAANNQAEERLQQQFSSIIKIINDAGVLVMSNIADKNVGGFTSQDLEKISQSGEVLLEKMDALVIEGSSPVAESGYLIAIAMAHHKPILYLAEKGKTIDKNLQLLQKDKNVGQFLRLQNYTDKTLESIILDFISSAEKGEGHETPTIKFTLRITNRIERYLHWKTHNTKISKADFLREMIEKMIDTDEEYKKYISKRSEE